MTNKAWRYIKITSRSRSESIPLCAAQSDSPFLQHPLSQHISLSPHNLETSWPTFFNESLVLARTGVSSLLKPARSPEIANRTRRLSKPRRSLDVCRCSWPKHWAPAPAPATLVRKKHSAQMYANVHERSWKISWKRKVEGRNSEVVSFKVLPRRMGWLPNHKDKAQPANQPHRHRSAWNSH